MTHCWRDVQGKSPLESLWKGVGSVLPLPHQGQEGREGGTFGPEEPQGHLGLGRLPPSAMTAGPDLGPWL